MVRKMEKLIAEREEKKEIRKTKKISKDEK